MPVSLAARDVLLGLHRRRQRLERGGEIRNVLVGRLADRVGELARLVAVTAEQDDADIEVVLQRRSFLPKRHPASIQLEYYARPAGSPWQIPRCFAHRNKPRYGPL